MSKQSHRPPHFESRTTGGKTAGLGLERMGLRARMLLRHGEFEQAEALARQALSTLPRDPAALYVMGLISSRKGDRPAAIAFFERAIAVDNEIALYHCQLGNAYLESEPPRGVEAAREFQYARLLKPDSMLARLGLGRALMAQKDHASAAGEFEAVTRLRPSHADAHRYLGIALLESKRIDDAVAHLTRAIALRPRCPVATLKLGIALRIKGDLVAAKKLLAHAIELDPRCIEAYDELASTYRALGREADSWEVLERALTLHPESSQGLCRLGAICIKLNRYEQAVDSYEQALAINPRSATAFRGIGRVRYLEHRFEESRAALASALELEPENAANYTAMGLSYQTEGRFDEAVQWQSRAITHQPSNAEAHYALSMMHASADRKERIRALEHALSTASLTPDESVILYFSLGKLCEDEGDYDSAFRYFTKGNELRKTRQGFSSTEEPAFVERSIAAYQPELFSEFRGVGNASSRPVFVVGMMRSGTTLVEQILASHPQVHGHGELEGIRWIAQSLGGQALEDDTIRRLAAEYLAGLERDAGESLRSVDKMPHNFRFLGLITLLFPRAKLIHCVRDPRDTCLSCYFHDLGIRNTFTRDLEELGRFYGTYRRLMAHWHAVLPVPILDVPYEGLVANQEFWSRKLIEFVGLPWDARCLDYHKVERPVVTSSFWQVRQPIYASSIGRWRHYERHLAPLLRVLEECEPESSNGRRSVTESPRSSRDVHS